MTLFGSALWLAVGLAAPAGPGPVDLARAGAPGPRTFSEPFVEVADVPGTLTTGDGRRITVLDARDKSAFRRGHIQGAQRIDWTDYRAGWLRDGRLPEDLPKLARELAALGVDEGRPVLVCGASSSGWGEEGRIAWMLRYLGHPEVAILDGGCRAWARAGRPLVNTQARRAARGRLRARPDKDLRVTLEELQAARKAGRVQLLDVRTREEYEGATPYYSSRGGHIPGAHHLHFKDLIGPGGKLLPAHVVRAKLKAVGVDPDRPIVTYCTGGVRSAFAAEALRAMSLKAKNYDGSWWEWSAQDELPVEKAGEKKP